MAGIIKFDEMSGHAQRVAFNFEDMTDKARGYLDDVRQQADKIVAEAKKQAEAIKQQAQQDGRRAAEQQAQQQVDAKVAKQFATALPALRAAADEIQRGRQAWIRQWENNVVGLAAAMARLIIRRELDRDPEISLPLVREALELAAGSAQIRLLLNPEDHKLLREHIESMAAEVKQAGDLEIVPDAAIAAGGCRVETRLGSIDQSIESQLTRIVEELMV